MLSINNWEIDNSQGHAFLHNGEVFYSPNSPRRIIISDRPGPSSCYRFHKNDALWEHFHDPQWWTQEYCFLSFVPLRPSFEGDTFGSLRDMLSFVVGPDSDNHFYLCEDKAAEWTQLQDWLFYISALLEQTIDTYPSLKPIPPSFLGFQKRFMPLRLACIRATTSRDWFVIWMGLPSFKVAAVSDWFGLLAEKDIPQIWLRAFECLQFLRELSQSRDYFGLVKHWQEPEKIPRWMVHISPLPRLVSVDSGSYKRLFKATICLPSTSCRSNTNGDNVISNSSPLTAHAISILATACNGEYQPTHNTKYDPAYSDEYECTYVPEGIQCRLKSIHQNQDPGCDFLKCELSKTKLSLNMRQGRNVD